MFEFKKKLEEDAQYIREAAKWKIYLWRLNKHGIFFEEKDRLFFLLARKIRNAQKKGNIKVVLIPQWVLNYGYPISFDSRFDSRDEVSFMGLPIRCHSGNLIRIIME